MVLAGLLLDLYLYPEDRGVTFIRNYDRLIPSYTAYNPEVNALQK